MKIKLLLVLCLFPTYFLSAQEAQIDSEMEKTSKQYFFLRGGLIPQIGYAYRQRILSSNVGYDVRVSSNGFATDLEFSSLKYRSNAVDAGYVGIGGGATFFLADVSPPLLPRLDFILGKEFDLGRKFVQLNCNFGSLFILLDSPSDPFNQIGTGLMLFTLDMGF